MRTSSQKEELSKDKIVDKAQPQPLSNLEKTVMAVRKDNLVRKWNSDITKSYMIQKKLGEGSFGEVFLVIHKQLKVERALKVINKYSKPHSNAADQLQLLKKLDHPNILNIFQYFETKEKWYIITQYFEGKELFDEIIDKYSLSEHISAQIIEEILKALNYIHSNKIAHRDIKAENILIRKNGNSYIVKVIDWGLGGILQGNDFNRKCGTPQYCAPEVLEGSYNMQCDMWSLGVLTYIMLSGYMPFKGKDVKETLRKVKQGNIDFSLPVWSQISTSAKEFIARLIEKDAHKRMKASEAINHPWIVNNSNFGEQKIKTEQNLEETLKRIKDFHTETKFQVLTINYILNFIDTPKQLEKLKKQFELLDLNKDGQISYDELLFAYRKIYGPEAELIVQKIFQNIDLDNSGKITFSQFITFATEITHNFSQEQLKEAFKLFDADNDGLIDKREISDLIQYEKGSPSTSQQFDQIISEIDLNNDGKIDFNEFIEHITRAVEKVKSKTSSTFRLTSEKKKQEKTQESRNSSKTEELNQSALDPPASEKKEETK